MTCRQFSILLFALLVSSLSVAELYLHTNFKCVSTVERREVHLYLNSGAQNDGPICRVDYLKGGVTETLWTAQLNAEFCETQARQLTERLENSSFKCVATATFDRDVTVDK